HASGPYCASHFNLTVEMSLGAVIRRYKIAQVPIAWYGRSWGCSDLHLREMGRRYLSTLLVLFFQKILVSDDILTERLAASGAQASEITGLRVAGEAGSDSGQRDEDGFGTSAPRTAV